MNEYEEAKALIAREDARVFRNRMGARRRPVRMEITLTREVDWQSEVTCTVLIHPNGTWTIEGEA